MTIPEHLESKRTPGRTIYANCADDIEHHMHEDGHKIWGMVIYRCTYENDNDWKEFEKRLFWTNRQELEACNGLEIWEKFKYTVHEDRALLDGATPDQVREHFDKWAHKAPEEEQGTGSGNATRYQKCIMVDAECLNAIVHQIPPPWEKYDMYHKGFVKVILGFWSEEDEDPTSSDDDGFVPEPREPLYGCTRDNVGWMKAAYTGILVVGESHLYGGFSWESQYTRPPDVWYS